MNDRPRQNPAYRSIPTFFSAPDVVSGASVTIATNQQNMHGHTHLFTQARNLNNSPQMLHGLGVLVTRPARQAQPLCKLIEQHGGIAISFPTLAIVPPTDVAPALRCFAHWHAYSLAIFTSVNAVEQALPLLAQFGSFPAGLEIAAIGQATAQALAQHGIPQCIYPEQGFTSEDLLALPRFQCIAGQRILLVRGCGGRTWLAETLTARGAQVDCAEVYQRIQPPLFDKRALLESWAQGAVGAVIATSVESLENLFAMLGTAGQPYLRNTPLIVVSARIQQHAAQQGCRHLLLAREASDQAVLAALFDLTTHFSTPPGN